MLRVFSDGRCLEHVAPPGYPEIGERLRGIVEHLRASGSDLVEKAPDLAAEEAVLALHDRSYRDRFKRAVERGDGLLDSADNPLSEGSWRAALAAVDVALAAADWIAAAPERLAFAAVRPPGHHAERGVAMGFCFFNNVALAADRLVRFHGLERVAIYDFDVHHGNGTQHLFETRSDVLYCSTHRYPFYPGTGAREERGRGPGEGFTVNVPLSAATGDEGHDAALREEILPAIRRFSPQCLLLSAGFDAWRSDPIGGMRVSEEGFRDWGRHLGRLAAEVCEGRVLAVLEGGYDVRALPRLVAAHLEGLREGLGG